LKLNAVGELVTARVWADDLLLRLKDIVLPKQLTYIAQLWIVDGLVQLDDLLLLRGRASRIKSTYSENLCSRHDGKAKDVGLMLRRCESGTMLV
jgi:hypothetical protein